MKKILVSILTTALCLCAVAQDNTPEMLKKKELFSKAELFENSAIYSSRAANAELLKDYETSPSSYKAEQLLPVATCYLTFGAIPQAKAVLESFLKTSPDNIAANRMLGSIYILEKDIDKAIAVSKKNYDAGDEPSLLLLCSSYVISNKSDLVTPYLPKLKELAKNSLEAFNLAMFYSLRDAKNPDKELQKELISNLDAEKAIRAATPDSMSTILRLYIGTRDLWSGPALTIPARAAALAEAWPIAIEAYKKALASAPKNAAAMRGMGFVSYRTGDVMGAANYVKKAYDSGDKDAVIDGVEIFLLSGNAKVWDMFKPYIKDIKLSPQVRANLVQYASRGTDAADIFYLALDGEEADMLYKDQGVRTLVEEGLKKYGNDMRAVLVSQKLSSIKADK